ncbi:hypothetical protein GGR56DRAFT_429408 [Xylariaceae sp. FL0804]|nr:hypothetical protein GGR56DRAFT_429408 [Xylariaceae sp. FL0804]
MDKSRRYRTLSVRVTHRYVYVSQSIRSWGRPWPRWCDGKHTIPSPLYPVAIFLCYCSSELPSCHYRQSSSHQARTARCCARPTRTSTARCAPPYTKLCYGLPFEKVCRKYVDGLGNVSRVYIMPSRSLSSQTQCLARLEAELGDKHAGTWIGAEPHSPYDGLVAIMNDVRVREGRLHRDARGRQPVGRGQAHRVPTRSRMASRRSTT